MQKHSRLSLVEHLQQIPDPRVKGRCAHELVDVLAIALCCLLCGGETFNDMEDFGRAKRGWFKTFLPLRGGTPGHETFNRVLAALKPAAFLDCFMRWTQSLRTAVADEIVALDGKALRRALERGQTPRVILKCLGGGQFAGAGPASGARQDQRNYRGAATPARAGTLRLHRHPDAMGCQKEIAREIKEADAVARHQESAPARKNKMPPGLQRNGGERPRADGNPALLAERGPGVVCRSPSMGRVAQRGRGGKRAAGGPGAADPGAPLFT